MYLFLLCILLLTVYVLKYFFLSVFDFLKVNPCLGLFLNSVYFASVDIFPVARLHHPGERREQNPDTDHTIAHLIFDQNIPGARFKCINIKTLPHAYNVHK